MNIESIKGIVEVFLQYGALGAIATVSIYQVLVMEKKMYSMIENNTRVLTELRKTIEQCQIVHWQQNAK